MNKRSNDTLDAVFSALADPTRRAILEALSEGHAQVSELAEPFEMSLPAISKHLRVLEEAGLIVRERDGRFHRMHLHSQPLKDAAEWLDHYRNFWNTRLDSLGTFLNKTKK
ncbi:MAG: winged helix-turn-helix transcriptional regulator [Ignavibacteriae bacterium]|nr:winged helix-turn-helix transcriptional regulator [Ignavibacteria bacterium]MBI3365671.1 winged helix-turn-helix transcriptional regulator [Ignavibacteriota bacterium]